MTPENRLARKAFPILFIAIVGMLIFTAGRSDSADKLTRVLRNLDSSKLRSIEIGLFSKMQHNLVRRPVKIVDKNDLTRITQTFRSMKRGYYPKGMRPFWRCSLRIDFDSSYHPPLKRPAEGIELSLEVLDNSCYLTLVGTMGLHTYVSDSLKQILEEITAVGSPSSATDR